MKIRINDITDAGLSLDVVEEGKVIEGLAGQLDFVFNSPVRAHLDITRTGKDIQISGDMKTALGFVCNRCLKPFAYPLDTGFSVYYTLGREPEREKELTAADIDVNFLIGDELDTADILFAQISLELPMQALCNDDCPGLCPVCGQDLNAGPCACPVKEKAEDTTDVRFAKLKEFKVK